MDTIVRAWLESEKRKDESLRKACKRLAAKVGIGYKYLYQLAYFPDRYTPSDELVYRIKKLYKPKKPRKKRNSVITDYPPGDPRKERAGKLSMAQRQDALDYWYHKEMMK